MKIALSACLLGENCKYNGGNNYSHALESFLSGHEIIPLCPEVMGGLSVPRAPAEIAGGEVICQDGTSVDKAFRDGAAAALRAVKESGAELVILQSRSPSCGVNQIYDGTFSGKLTRGDGVFAVLLKENGIAVKDVEEVEAVNP